MAHLKQFIINPLSPNSAQNQFSPNNIHRLASIQTSSLFWGEVLGDHPHSGCIRACLHGYGGPQVHVGEVTRLDGVTRMSI